MRNFTITKVVVFFIFCVTVNTNAQIVISKPSLGFTQACASPSFNTYNVTFSFSPESGITGTNQFIVELSDDAGSFATPTVLYTSAQGSVTTSPATLSFSIPISTSGEAYKIRIKSTSPVATSTPSDAFAAYYKIQDTPFSINNLISTAAYCSGGSYLLTIDNPGTGDNDSPLQYPSLTFNWYKETSQTTSVFIASGESLSVNQPGTYFVETNYGTCTSNSYSNRVTISESTSSTSSEISSSLGNPYCSSEGATTLSAINGNSYQWYKEGVAISGATSQMYETNEPGKYSVTIDLGGCSISASIDLENSGFSSSIDVPENNTIDEGETLVATVTTDAINPEFEWYLNGTLISGEINNSYEATQTGNYKVVISQTSGCIASTEFMFIVREAFPNVSNIPNLISPNGDGLNDTWVIPQEYVNGANAEVSIISSQGEIVHKTNDYLNNWPENQLDFKDVNPVYYYIIKTADNKTRKGSITVVK
ncbi:gliding motility-associated C-terminal domain-containing protein [Sabulilitoribacter multivorans]|uniref:Gliding motility-associated C-terminal domain-containing protein n=1 Tax=Flaviramulus multivorans TaxID=1304750 RepID=A0ABS9IGX7_9FLAO|nr:gliding motility-associated C-terminal domain-containing protein [Flaviramulus multivorans]MCF7560011.1 gliding motility-associated C-terminal domain-containing protein [Flaviramulus multivorans]